MNILFRALLLLAALCPAAARAITVQLIPSLPPVITNVDLSQYDFYGTGITQPMFILRIDNSGDPAAYVGIRVRYTTYFVDGSSEIKLYEGLSNKFNMNPGEVVTVSSSDFLQKNNASVKVSIEFTLDEISDMDFRRKVLDSQRAPDGELRYTVELLQGNTVLTNDTFDRRVLNTMRIELVTPGADASETLPVVADPNPVFIWSSELPPYANEGNDVFELRVYKARSGESMAEATSRTPILREGTTLQQLTYPTTGEQLIPGVTYYWQVIGFLKGLTSTKLKSDVFGFKLVKTLDPRVMEVLNLLRLIYDENTLEQVYDYSEDVSIRIDNETVDVDELRELVQEILRDEKEIQSTTVR